MTGMPANMHGLPDLDSDAVGLAGKCEAVEGAAGGVAAQVYEHPGRVCHHEA